MTRERVAKLERWLQVPRRDSRTAGACSRGGPDRGLSSDTDPAAGTWEFPGGHVEGEESAWQAAQFSGTPGTIADNLPGEAQFKKAPLNPDDPGHPENQQLRPETGIVGAPTLVSKALVHQRVRKDANNARCSISTRPVSDARTTRPAATSATMTRAELHKLVDELRQKAVEVARDLPRRADEDSELAHLRAASRDD